ncbi:MAG: radical SAM family heme chaperone HemW [Desulfatirhabdiaceae bacterium]
MAPGLYIHIPFCIKKCVYCDFYSITDLSLRGTFCESLKKEMDLIQAFPSPFDSLYLGGGTPSILGSHQIAGIIEATRNRFSMANASEITIEANPGTISLKKCQDYRSMGINRLQIGIQSFQDRYLAFLGRIHSSDEAKLAIQYARKSGFSNIGLDLIYGIPGQNQTDLLSDLRQAVIFEPEHVSCYMLTCEPGTALDLARKRREFQLAQEDDMAVHYLTVVEFLESNGYEQYEISNFARRHHRIPGHWRSRHNQKYWQSEPYLGLGPSAHSFSPPQRSWNYRNMAAYCKAVSKGMMPLEGTETLTPDQQMMEAIYLGLRTTDGISLAEFEYRFQRSLMPVIEATLTDSLVKNLAVYDGNRFRLRRSGMLMMDSIAGFLINHI